MDRKKNLQLNTYTNLSKAHHNLHGGIVFTIVNNLTSWGLLVLSLVPMFDFRGYMNRLVIRRTGDYSVNKCYLLS